MRTHLPTEHGLELRSWRVTDGPMLLSSLAPEEMQRQFGRVIDTVPVAEEWIAAGQLGWRDYAAYSWTAVAGSQVVGSATVSAVDRTHDTGWFSYWTADCARGTGVATAATRAVADWALSDLGLFRLELGHRTNNPASCAVASRAGFAIEGLQRAKLRYGGERFDVEIHSRLATDRR
ncbi:MAG: GNAT family protein [Pseudonocardiales bacterium]